MQKYNHARIIIWLVALWIYGLLIYSFLVNKVTFLITAVTFLPILAVYLYLIAREVSSEDADFANRVSTPFMAWFIRKVAKRKQRQASQKKPSDGTEVTAPARRGGLIGRTIKDMQLRFFVEAFIAIFLALALAYGTLVLVDQDVREETTANFITCERDDSRITELPVNKILNTDQATITVHEVVYNVPQHSEKPTSYSYQCEKATLVNVTVERKDTADVESEKIRPFDFTLQGADIKATQGESDTDEYDYYADQNDLNFFDRSIDTDTQQESGWIVFSVLDENSNNDSRLIFGGYPYDEQPSVALPVDK